MEMTYQRTGSVQRVREHETDKASVHTRSHQRHDGQDRSDKDDGRTNEFEPDSEPAINRDTVER